MTETKRISLNLEKVSVILLDVAGTTTAIGFVKETLFPYITKNAEDFLKQSWDNEDIKKAISEFEEKDLDVTKASEIVKTLTQEDSSNSGLKTIQGLILKKGYENGDLKGHVFEDAAKCLESWSKSKKVAIFSSGSKEAQQLLFKNSSEGDLTVHICKYFDQSAGDKTEPETYKKISAELDVDCENILFLTDDVKEADAAKSADVVVALIERDGNSSISDDDRSKFTVVKSFEEIVFEPVKRKIEEACVEEPPSKIAKTENDETNPKLITEEAQLVEKSEAEPDKTEEKFEAEQVQEKCEEVIEAEKEQQTPEEPMEVDSEVVATETKADPELIKKSVEQATNETEQKQETVSAEEKAEVKTADKEESMEVTDSTLSNQENVDDKTEDDEEKKIVDNKEQTTIEDKKENKTEIEIGTQTKTVTNECETQTTISIKVTENLASSDVENKLMAAKTQEIQQTIQSNEESKEKVEEVKMDDVEIKDTQENRSGESTGTEDTDKVVDKNEDQTHSKPEEIAECSVDPTKSDDSQSVAVETKDEVVEKISTAQETVNKQDEVATEQKEKLADNQEKVVTEQDEVSDEQENTVNKEEKVVTEPEKIVTEHKKIENVVTDQEKVTSEQGKQESEKEKLEIQQEKVEDDSDNKEKEILKDADKNTNGEVTEVVEVISKENGVARENSPDKVEEKENKSELANGKEIEGNVPNSEASDTNGVEKKEGEIKVKAIDGKADSAPVTVES